MLCTFTGYNQAVQVVSQSRPQNNKQGCRRRKGVGRNPSAVDEGCTRDGEIFNNPNLSKVLKSDLISKFPQIKKRNIFLYISKNFDFASFRQLVDVVWLRAPDAIRRAKHDATTNSHPTIPENCPHWKNRRCSRGGIIWAVTLYHPYTRTLFAHSQMRKLKMSVSGIQKKGKVKQAELWGRRPGGNCQGRVVVIYFNILRVTILS